MAPKISQQALINKWTFRYTSCEIPERQFSSKTAQFTELEDVKITNNEHLKCLQELEVVADDIVSCPLAAVQIFLSDAHHYEAANVR